MVCFVSLLFRHFGVGTPFFSTGSVWVRMLSELLLTRHHFSIRHNIHLLRQRFSQSVLQDIHEEIHHATEQHSAHSNERQSCAWLVFPPCQCVDKNLCLDWLRLVRDETSFNHHLPPFAPRLPGVWYSVSDYYCCMKHQHAKGVLGARPTHSDMYPCQGTNTSIWASTSFTYPQVIQYTHTFTHMHTKIV